MDKITQIQWLINIGGSIDPNKLIKGGFQVPLFILIISLMGGVINMLLKFPEFHSSYDQIQPGTPIEATQVTELRAKVFRYFVYIITAPFLGMIVYCFVTLADYTNAFALSVMSFSVGFTSDQIVETLLAVAGNILGRSKDLFKK